MLRKFPRYVAIETINTCNARCPFCPLFRGDSPMSRDLRPAEIMSAELFDSVVAQVAGWRTPPDSLFLNMNGEPLQDPNFVDRCAILRRHGLGPKIELQTNAQFLGDEQRRAILDTDVGRLVIGFDAASRPVYEKHRVRCDYDRVLGNIHAFVALRAKLGKRTRIAIQYVRTRENSAEVLDAWRMFSEILDSDLDCFQDDISKDWGDRQGADDYFFLPKRDEPVEVADCQPAAEQLIINSDGKIQACCWDYNLSVSEGGLGDAAESDLLEIWNSQRRRNALAKINHADPSKRPQKCVSCEYNGARPVPQSFKSDLPPEYLASSTPYGHIFFFPKKAAAE